MPDCMTFPEHWEDFIDSYSFVDEKHIYTNGARLITVLRVTQLIDHLLLQKDDEIARLNRELDAMNRLSEMQMEALQEAVNG